MSPLLDSKAGYTLILMSDDESVLRSFDEVASGQQLQKMELSDAAYVLPSALPSFSIGVFLPSGVRRNTRVLQKQLQALEPIKGGRLGVPAIDGYMPHFVSSGEIKNVPGRQRPVELLRHIIR